ERLEHDIDVLVIALEHKNGTSPHPVERLADDPPMRERERGQLAHNACNQSRRTAFWEPCRVYLLVHIPQALRPVDDESALFPAALENVRAVDVFGIERRILTHQNAVELAQRPDARLAELKPALRIGCDGQ